VIAGLAYIAWSAFHFYTRPKVGESAPAFVLKDLSGREVAFPGEDPSPAIIHFWATWCGQCMSELISFNRFYDVYSNKGLKIFAISIDEEKQAVEAVMENMGFAFPVLLDSKGTASDLYRNVGVPETVIINSEGIIFERFVGAADWNSEKLHATIDTLFLRNGGKNVPEDKGTQGR